MTPPNHKHTPVTDALGRNICSTCQMVVWNPILSSDDPRLIDAGLMRSKHHDEDIDYPPLPELLIGLYFNGRFLGIAQPPRAPYIEIVAQEMGNRSQGTIDPDDMWIMLRGWHDVQRNKTDSKTAYRSSR